MLPVAVLGSSLMNVTLCGALKCARLTRDRLITHRFPSGFAVYPPAPPHGVFARANAQIVLSSFTPTASTHRAWSGPILKQSDECAWRAESPCMARWRTTHRESNELPHRTRVTGGRM